MTTPADEPLTAEEAEEIRNRALSAHIQHGQLEIQRIDEQITSLRRRRELMVQEVQAMIEARALLSKPEEEPSE